MRCVSATSFPTYFVSLLVASSKQKSTLPCGRPNAYEMKTLLTAVSTRREAECRRLSFPLGLDQ